MVGMELEKVLEIVVGSIIILLLYGGEIINENPKNALSISLNWFKLIFFSCLTSWLIVRNSQKQDRHHVSSMQSTQTTPTQQNTKA